MFRKAKKISLIASAALAAAFSSSLHAIGLGEITLKTPLNEPLDAEIKLLQVGDLGENEILINLASKADFEAAGVERAFFLTSLRFALELDNPAGPMIRVSTDSAVREPYLNFLLEIQWPNGRLLREYTLLMDLPAYDGGIARARAIQGTQAPVLKQEKPAVAHKPAPEALDLAQLEAELQALEATTVTANAAPKSETAAPAMQDPAPVGGDVPAEGEETMPAPQDVVEVEVEEDSVETLEAETVATADVEMVAEDAVVETEQSQPVYEYETSIPVYSGAGGGEYGPVQGGDNLWSIASQHRPDKGVSVQQTMLAIQSLNPEAFINGNINMLKKGQVLRMPTRDQITDFTNREAFAEVRRQNIEWSGDPNGRKASEVEQLDATAADVEMAVVEPDYEEGHLKLTAPGQVDGSAAGKASGSEEGSLEAMQNELVISMEELDRAKREQAEMKDAVSELDDQMQTIEQMLEIRSAELEALEAALAGGDDVIDDGMSVEDGMMDEEVVEDVVEDMGVENMGADMSEGGMMDEEVADDLVMSEEAVEVAIEDETVDAAVTAPAEMTQIEEPAPAPASSGGIVDLIMQNIAIIGGALLALIIGLVAVMKLRGRSSDDSDELDLEEDDFDIEAAVDGLDEDSLDNLDEVAESLESTLDEELDIAAEDTAPAQAETSDVLGEVDIYISFGNYDKAEGLLKSAISAEPQRTDLQLKMLELFSEKQDLAGFDEQYSSLAALGDQGAVERAQELRAKIDGADASDLPAAAADEDDIKLDLDLSDDEPATDDSLGLDLDLDLSLDEEEPGLVEEPAADSDFDLDLDLDLSGDLEDVAAEEPAAEPSADLDFDLDLSLDEDLSVAEEPAISISDAPTQQQPALDISETPTMVSPAVSVGDAPTEARDELDLDLSGLDDLGGDFTSEAPTVSTAAVEAPAETAVEDAPTPADTALDDEFDFLADADEAATKLDLARAYIDMGDKEGARDILQEVLEEGQETQKQEAQQLLESI